MKIFYLLSFLFISFLTTSNVLADLVKGKWNFVKDEDYCYIGNLSDGFDWIHNNKKQAFSKIKAGQIYVSNRFSKEIISKKWLKLICKNLNTRIGV